MYCKKCGRKLEDGMRFCDRCGQSVRQSQNSGKEVRRQEIAELKQERLNRKQKLIEKENKKKINKSINRKKMNLLAIIFIILFCILITAVIAYKLTIDKSENAAWRTQDGSVELNASQMPTHTPAPTDKAGAVVTAMPTSTAYAITSELNADGYREFKCSGGSVLPYPASFLQQTPDGNTKLNLYDKNGGASITVTETGPVSLAAKELMSQFAKEQPGKVQYSRAGDGWYVVETSENDLVHHRKCVIINNIAIAYDFSYSTASTAASTYQQQIAYMDEHFSS